MGGDRDRDGGRRPRRPGRVPSIERGTGDRGPGERRAGDAIRIAAHGDQSQRAEPVSARIRRQEGGRPGIHPLGAAEAHRQAPGSSGGRPAEHHGGRAGPRPRGRTLEGSHEGSEEGREVLEVSRAGREIAARRLPHGHAGGPRQRGGDTGCAGHRGTTPGVLRGAQGRAATARGGPAPHHRREGQGGGRRGRGGCPQGRGVRPSGPGAVDGGPRRRGGRRAMARCAGSPAPAASRGRPPEGGRDQRTAAGKRGGHRRPPGGAAGGAHQDPGGGTPGDRETPLDREAAGSPPGMAEGAGREGEDRGVAVMARGRHRPAARALLPGAILLVLTGLMAGAATTLAPGRAWSAEPEILARVNGEPVTREDMQRLLVRRLIDRRLILQEAGRRKFTVPQQDMDAALTALRGRFDDLKSFGMWMHERGLDDKSLFDTLRTDMLMKRVTAALVEKVRPTHAQVQEYYEAHKEDLKTPGEVRLRIIAVKDKAAAQEIVAALQRGENFQRLARERSIGIRAAKGGDSGWVAVATLPPPLRQAVDALKVGEANGPLQKDAEFLIVGLAGRRPGRTKTLDEARAEIERGLLPARQQEVFQAWLKEQEEKSKIEVLL